MNPNSNYYLAINTGFPNAYDRANDRHGGFLMNSWRLLLARLLRHDRRADRREIYSLARKVVPRRSAVIPDPGLSVPHDASEPGAPSHQSASRLLENAQDRQRSFRGDASRGAKVDPVCDEALSLFDAVQPRGLRVDHIQLDRPLPGLCRRTSGNRRPGAWKSRMPTRVQYAALVKANTWTAPVRFPASMAV